MGLSGGLASNGGVSVSVGELPPSVAIVSSPNFFTAGQTVNSTNPLTLQDGAGNNLARITNIASAGNDAGNIDLYGTNGLSATKQAWYIGIDVSATTPYRDLAIGKYLAGGAVSDPDGIYISNGGINPSTIGIGMSQPGDTSGSYRLKLASGATTQGGLQIRQFASQTAHMLALTDSGGTTEHVWVDPSNANTWLTVLTGDTSVGNPVLRIVDVNTNTTIAFELQATGQLIQKNAGAVAVQHKLQNSVQSSLIQTVATGELNIGNANAPNVIVVGNHSGSWTSLGFFGHAASTQQSAAGAATGYAAGATVATFHSDDTYTGNTGTTGYTINGIVAALKNYGLLAA